MMNTISAGSTRAGREKSRPSPEEIIIERIEALTFKGIVDPDGPTPGMVRRWLIRHSMDDLLLGIDKSFSIHVRMVDDDVDLDSAKKALHKVPALTETVIQERTRPWLGKLLYIQGIIRNKLGLKSYKALDYLEHLHRVEGRSLTAMESAAKSMDEWEGPDFETLTDWFLGFQRRI